MIDKNCEYCGVDFLSTHNRQRFCSIQCAAKHRGEKIRQNKIDKYKILIPEIEKYRENHTTKEAAKYFGISDTLLRGILSEFGLVSDTEKRILSYPPNFTQEQEETIIGNLLGDGSINWESSSSYNRHFTIGQKQDREEYILGLYDIYSPFSSSISKGRARKPSRVNGKINHDIENWNGEYSYYIAMQTVSLPLFTDLRYKWYKHPEEKKSPKIIPPDLRLTWRTAAIWVCDDGYNKIDHHRAMSIYTDSFSIPDVEFLVDRLKEDLGIISHIVLREKKPIINLYGDEWFNFIEGIKEFIPWNCFQYKCEHGKIFTRMRASVMKENSLCDCITASQKRAQKGKPKLMAILEERSWELLSEFIGLKKKHTLRCQHGKEFKRWWNAIKNGSKCDCKIKQY